MDSDNGGLSPEERQKRTAAEIARRKVMAAYGQPFVAQNSGQGQGSYQNASSSQTQAYQNTQNPEVRQSPQFSRFNKVSIEPTKVDNYNALQNGKNVETELTVSAETKVSSTGTTAYKQAPIQQDSNQFDWQKYHSAWQNYYQKYYSDYYSKAARTYVETERMKDERKLRDEARRYEPESRDERSYVKSDITEDQKDQVELTLRQRVQKRADSRFHLKKKHKKFIPIIAGVSVVLIVLFLQYNRMIFAPIAAYISPGNATEGSIAVVDGTVNKKISPESKLYVPKLNIEVPVFFGIANDNATTMYYMNLGVAHFRVPGASAFPGEYGNVVISGHSAGDVYSHNQYKFIFSGLERLVNDDLIYIDYNSVRYTYKVVTTKTVNPNDVASLSLGASKKYVTLLTCWPLGTSNYRLLVIGEQVDPGYEEQTESGATETTIVTDETKPSADADTVTESNMPANDKTFFEKIWDAITSFFRGIWEWIFGSGESSSEDE